MWTLVLTHIDALGGRQSPARIEGYLCPRCNDAVEDVGAVGPTSLTQAMLGALMASDDQATRAKAEKVRNEGLDVRPIGWGALVAHARQQNPPEPDPRPNTRPWGHLDDLAALSEQLSAALS